MTVFYILLKEVPFLNWFMDKMFNWNQITFVNSKNKGLEKICSHVSLSVAVEKTRVQ